jgi:uncharacterized protein with WD repeat
MALMIELTPEQVALICKPIQTAADKRMAYEARKAERKLTNAKAETAKWRSSYGDVKRNLLAALTETTELKRRLRNGDWEDV